MEADAAVTAYRRVKASDEVCALDTIVAGLIARFQQLCTKRLVSCWTLNDSWLVTLLTLMTCRGNVQILRQHSQTTSTLSNSFQQTCTSWRSISQLESGTADSVDSVYFCCWLPAANVQSLKWNSLWCSLSLVNNDGKYIDYWLLTNLSILSVERETVEQVDFNKRSYWKFCSSENAESFDLVVSVGPTIYLASSDSDDLAIRSI